MVEQDKLGNPAPIRKRWVIKIGSALLTDQGCNLKSDMLSVWAEQIVQLIRQQHQIILVSSGAVAAGLARMHWSQRPKIIHELQAVAAIGQMSLVQAWESCFQRYAVHTAQVLLTHDDVADRQRYLNVRTSLSALIKWGVVPIVNENDTVATDEIRFGDNDTLAGLIVNLVEADLLVILTDQDGLYEADPAHFPGAKKVQQADAGDSLLEQFAGQGGHLGRGGMKTKLRAAKIAAQSGANTIIASGTEKDILTRLAQGAHSGTLLKATQARFAAKKQWLAGHAKSRGVLHLDAGATKALVAQGKSLLAIGVTGFSGNFKRGEIVSCENESGDEVARGLINYNAAETQRIIGKSSHQFTAILGYPGELELIHRDNLVVLADC